MEKSPAESCALAAGVTTSNDLLPIFASCIFSKLCIALQKNDGTVRFSERVAQVTRNDSDTGGHSCGDEQVSDIQNGEWYSREPGNRGQGPCCKVYYIYNKDRLGIERIGVFGSFARGEETAESDIDIIVSLQEPTLFRYAEIADHLKSVFGREIDLVSLKSHMPETFKLQLEKEAIYVS